MTTSMGEPCQMMFFHYLMDIIEGSPIKIICMLYAEFFAMNESITSFAMH